MNVNIKFQGAVEKILEEAVRQGYASTKTEALRLGVFELNNRYELLDKIEDKEDAEMADRIMGEISRGKMKTRSKKDIMSELE